MMQLAPQPLRGPLAPATFLFVCFAVALGTSAFAQPANDVWPGEYLGNTISGSVQGTTVGASRQSGEPTHNTTSNSTVWYTWRAPSTAQVTFSTCTGTSYDSIIAAYTGAGIGALSQVAIDDDTCGTQSEMSFTPTKGTDYYIVVTGFDLAVGSFTLGWAQAPQPVGSLSVFIEPEESVTDGAAWRRVGSLNWSTTTFDVENNVPVGTWTVEFRDATGWVKPADFLTSVVANTETFSGGTYTRPPGNLVVVIQPSAAAADGAQWRRVGTEPWLNNLDRENGLPHGPVQIEFKPTRGWITPPVGNFTINGGFTNIAGGTYGRAEMARVNVTSVPANGGTATISPEPFAGTQHVAGESLTLTAVPAPGFKFRQWSGDLLSDQNPASNSFSGENEVVAAFASESGSDLYEPNDTFQDAQPVDIPSAEYFFFSLSDLKVGAGNEDWYRLNIRRLNHLRIDAVFQHGLGNIQLQLWDRRSTIGDLGFGQAVGESYGSTISNGIESITYTNVSDPGSLWLRVYVEDGPGFETPYQLHFTSIQDDDGFDRQAPNNGPCESVTEISLNQTYEDLILRDEDWYRVALPQGTSTISVEALHNYFSGDVNLMVIGDVPSDCGGAFGRIIGGGFSTNAGENFERITNLNVSGRGSVLIRVFGATNFQRNQYDLRVTAVQGP